VPDLAIIAYLSAEFAAVEFDQTVVIATFFGLAWTLLEVWRERNDKKVY
jgi:hypothetical protein